MVSIVPIVLALIILLGYGSRSTEHAAASFIFSAVLLVATAYSYYSIFEYYRKTPQASYLVIPIDAAILVPLMIFSYQAQKVPVSFTPSGSMDRPISAAALSMIGGSLLAIAGLFFVAVATTSFMSIPGAYWLVLGTVIAFAGLRMYLRPSSAHTWGIATIVMSIIAGLNQIALIGGILAIRWKPKAPIVTPISPTPFGQVTKYCLHCGAQIHEGARFCSKCGGSQV